MSFISRVLLMLDRSETAQHIRAIRAGTADQFVLETLLASLIEGSGQVQERYLWWIIATIHLRADPGDENDLQRILWDIYRAANWEIQRRYRAV